MDAIHEHVTPHMATCCLGALPSATNSLFFSNVLGNLTRLLPLPLSGLASLCSFPFPKKSLLVCIIAQGMAITSEVTSLRQLVP